MTDDRTMPGFRRTRLDVLEREPSPRPVTDCQPCDGSGYVQLDRGCGVWEDRECPSCAGTGQQTAPPHPR
jgi:DnaJ-class molecular chaperone